jgi:hypothetical protein
MHIFTMNKVAGNNLTPIILDILQKMFCEMCNELKMMAGNADLVLYME